MKALIFDCDGVLADTERDGHRVAFNLAFAALGLNIEWSVVRYGELLRVAGGRERLRHFFAAAGWPPGSENDREGLVGRLHEEKSRIFRQLSAGGSIALRRGVNRLVDEAHAAGVKLAVCSTSSRESVVAVMDLMGSRRKTCFDAVLGGEDVRRKKPHPEIYDRALARLGLTGRDCLVIEDSRIGLQAALGAGARCLVTTSTYTLGEDFTGACRVVPSLGDPPGPHLSLTDLEQLLHA